jgi:two-component system response regulator FlrC
MTERATIAIVEDDPALREILCETAETAGYRVLGHEDGTACLKTLQHQDVDLVLTDLQMAPMDGLTLLREIRRRTRELPVVLMTAHGTIQSAIDAMRNGATDYLVKPFEAEVLMAGLDQWLPPTPPAQDEEMIAEDPATRRVLELARRVAATDASVLITGESGVGKEVFFRFLHRHSPRAKHESIAINCAAIPDNMLEAILFGHEKGAFTGAYKPYPGKFEQAQGSSLLLDEVSEMSLPLQAKLLRVLQERVVERLGSQELIKLDVRVVATSNRDLAAEVRAGRFREDLYYRLNVFPLAIPPLRERPADIVPLARFLLARAASKGDSTVPVLSAAARQALTDYAWPGNVRELDNVMQRALVIQSGGLIEAADLLFEAALTPRPAAAISRPIIADDDVEDDLDEGELDSLGDGLRDHERRLIIEALEEGRGSRKFAAEKLGISGRTLRYKLARMRDQGVAVPGR